MPGGVRHRRVAQHDSTVPREQPSPIKECGTPVATVPPQTVSRLQSCVATDSEELLRPGVGEGHTTILRRGRCANLLCEAAQDCNGSSAWIEEQNRTDWEQMRVSPFQRFVRHQRAFARMIARCSFVVPQKGADVPSCQQPNQTGWRTGQGVATCLALSLP